MGKRLKKSRPALIYVTASTKCAASGFVSGSPMEKVKTVTAMNTGKSRRFTSGPAAMLHNQGQGRGGGLTKATPPKGQSTILSARPPTERQANACPNSCRRTMAKRVTYSAMFQMREVYADARN